MGELFEATDGYEQRLDAMEDQCRVRIEGVVTRYREMFGDDDPDAHRLWNLCRGTQRIWTLGLDEAEPQTPEEFAEAVDRTLFEEQGSKGRARAEMQRMAAELAEHMRLLATMPVAPAPSTTSMMSDASGPAASHGTRGPARMAVHEAWRYVTTLQAWTLIQHQNQGKPQRQRKRKSAFAREQGITTAEMNAMLAWYRKYQTRGLFPMDPNKLTRDQLDKLFA